MKKIALIVLIGFFSIQSVFAQTRLSQTIIADFSSAIDIQNKAGTITSSKINPVIGSLESLLNPSFIVTSNNKNSSTILLYGRTQTSVGDFSSIFKKSNNTYIMLGNNGINTPKKSALVNIRANPISYMNPNVIAYPFVLNVDNKANVNYINDEKNFSIDIQIGKTSADINIGTQAMPNTYSNDDNFGTYSTTIYAQLGGKG